MTDQQFIDYVRKQFGKKTLTDEEQTRLEKLAGTSTKAINLLLCELSEKNIELKKLRKVY